MDGDLLCRRLVKVAHVYNVIRVATANSRKRFVLDRELRPQPSLLRLITCTLEKADRDLVIQSFVHDRPGFEAKSEHSRPLPHAVGAAEGYIRPYRHSGPLPLTGLGLIRQSATAQGL